KRRVAAAAADQREDLVLVHELLDGGDRRRGIAAVVLANQLQLAPVDAARGIDLVEYDLDPVHRQLAVEIAGAGQRAERTDLDAVGRNTWLLGRCRYRDRRYYCGCGPKPARASHRHFILLHCGVAPYGLSLRRCRAPTNRVCDLSPTPVWPAQRASAI